MKKNIKNLLLIMIVLLGVFTLAGCGNKYKYPSETPEVTNPKEVVLTIGDYKVTKEQMYYRNLTSYGVDVLNSLIDDALLPKFESLTAEEKADYEDYKNEKIYLTTDLEKLDAEEKADAEKTFKKRQVL
jgi:predicted small lipoprotein YifL